MAHQPVDQAFQESPIRKAKRKDFTELRGIAGSDFLPERRATKTSGRLPIWINRPFSLLLRSASSNIQVDSLSLPARSPAASLNFGHQRLYPDHRTI
jgi:hypothetical protein